MATIFSFLVSIGFGIYLFVLAKRMEKKKKTDTLQEGAWSDKKIYIIKAMGIGVILLGTIRFIALSYFV